ncbi:MAG: nucleotidyltransferase domain-containing protein [Chlamydiae bacterium]|nr:nucleotidyltransferase domain-containing protein [Chlamydiota bacterium]
MRLTQKQIDSLLQATRLYFGNTAKIWLFGSRVDDSKTGGDIDLYIETDKETGIIVAKLQMLTTIETVFGDQKIDILVRRRSHPCSPIQEIAKSTGEELHSSK